MPRLKALVSRNPRSWTEERIDGQDAEKSKSRVAQLSAKGFQYRENNGENCSSNHCDPSGMITDLSTIGSSRMRRPSKGTLEPQ